MIECKVLIPFVSVDSNIALNVNDIIVLKVEKAKELEVKGLVEITANPLNLNNSSTPQASDDEDIGEHKLNKKSNKNKK